MQNKSPLGIAYSGGSNSAPVNGAGAPRDRRLLIFVIITLVVVLLATGTIWWVLVSTRQNTVSSQFQNTNLDLTDIANTDFKDNEELSILGQLNINGGFAIKPTSQPATPDPGQIYYDQNTNVLSYYNGTQFIALDGNLNVGPGITNNAGVLTNSGVLSVQGQTGDVTLTAGNGITISGTTISATNGGVGGSGTTGRLVKFTGSQTIGNSLLNESGTTVSVLGDLSVTGGLSLSTSLTVANGGTGASSLTANGVLIGNGTGAITSVVAGGAGLCLQSTAGAPTFAACPGGGGGVTSLNGLSGALTLANASGVGSTVTIDDATTAAKGIASFNSTNFSVASGAVNTIQDISTSSSPTFNNLTLSGDLAVNGNDITSTGAINIVSGGSGDVTIDAAGSDISLLDATTAKDSLTVRDSSTPTKQLRMRSTGGALDFESGGGDLHFSTWTGADFTGTQRKHLVMVGSGDLSVVLGDWDWYTSEFGAQHNSITSGTNRFNIDQQAVNFIASGDTDANLLYVKGFGDSVGIGTSNPGFKLEVNGTLGVSGLASLTSLGAADTGNYLCRNSSNQIATCSTTGTGVAFVQGGNSFAGTAILGTNDNNDLTFERNNTTMLTVGANNVALASGIDLVLQGANAYITNKQGFIDSESFGDGATVGADGTVAIGASATAANLGSIAIGHGATTTASNQLVIGGGTHYVNSVVIGNGVTSSSPQGVQLQATSASGADVAGADLTIVGGQSTGNAFGGSINFKISAPGVSGSGLNTLSTALSIGGAAGAAQFQNATNTTSAFNIKNQGGNNILTIDTVNSRLGFNLGGNSTPVLAGTGIEVKGALRFSDGETDTFTTPQGSGVGSKININLFDPPNFGQVLALGLGSIADTTTRVISLFDARGSAHQPSLAVLSPNENQIGGLSWEGTNTDFMVKNSASSGGTIGLLIGSTTRLQATTAGADVTGILGVSSLGSADTATYICRNSANALASCNTTGAGVAFINGGNSLGAAATLGTNDGNALNFETNNVTRISISSTGDITIGTSDTTGSLLVLDTKTNGGDPTGVNGGMYYNSALAVMRCYTDGFWHDCSELSPRTTYEYVNDFVKVPANSQADDTLTAYGEYFNVGSATYLAGHPGVLQLAASTNGNKSAITSGSSFENQILFGNGVTWRYEVLALVPSVSTSGERYVYTTGFNDTTDTIASITNGCYFRYSDDVNSGNWQGVCEDGTESTCDTTVTIVADQWKRLTMVVNDTGTSVDFQVDGVSKCTITTHIPATTSLMSFESIINKTVGNAFRGVYMDYLSVHAQLTSAR